MPLLESQQTELEKCEAALADYMEAKRRAFPRFYFVATADLLDLLSNGSDPVHVQQHMSKCFQVGGGMLSELLPHWPIGPKPLLSKCFQMGGGMLGAWQSCGLNSTVEK